MPGIAVSVFSRLLYVIICTYSLTPPIDVKPEDAAQSPGILRLYVDEVRAELLVVAVRGDGDSAGGGGKPCV